MNISPEQDLLASILPSGILEYFTISTLKNNPDSFNIYLEEKNIHPIEYKGQELTSKGFFELITVQDFSLRGKAVFLKTRRRRWFNKDIGLTVFRDWASSSKGNASDTGIRGFFKSIG